MIHSIWLLIVVKPSDELRRTKEKDPTPELTEESSMDSIQEVEADISMTSIEDSFIQQSAPKKPRGRPAKTEKTKVKSTPQPTKGVRGRKPKLAVVPETQVEVSIVEEESEEVDEIEMAPRPRQGSVLPASMTRKSNEVWSRRERTDFSGLERRIL
jgi:hypothetical protein